MPKQPRWRRKREIERSLNHLDAICKKVYRLHTEITTTQQESESADMMLNIVRCIFDTSRCMQSLLELFRDLM